MSAAQRRHGDPGAEAKSHCGVGRRTEGLRDDLQRRGHAGDRVRGTEDRTTEEEMAAGSGMEGLERAVEERVIRYSSFRGSLAEEHNLCDYLLGRETWSRNQLLHRPFSCVL